MVINSDPKEEQKNRGVLTGVGTPICIVYNNTIIIQFLIDSRIMNLKNIFLHRWGTSIYKYPTALMQIIRIIFQKIIQNIYGIIMYALNNIMA